MSDTIPVVVTLWNYMKDNAEFKNVPAFEIIGALDIMKAKLQYDMFKKLETDYSMSMEDFLRTLK